jgi:hypothetical protein
MVNFTNTLISRILAFGTVGDTRARTHARTHFEVPLGKIRTKKECHWWVDTAGSTYKDREKQGLAFTKDYH